MGTPRQIYGIALAVLVLVMIAAGLAFLFDFPGEAESFDMDSSGPRLIALSALSFVFMASLLFGTPRVREILRATVFWGGLMLVLLVGYAYRGDLVQGGYRVLGALAPGLAVEQPDGSVMVVRNASGHFHLDATVNGAGVRFLVDTGASAVVLTQADARAAGIAPESLSYSIPVTTANGRTLVAPARIDTIAVGPVRLTDVRAFVARPGSLETSLFGMSALGRLSGYRVEGDRLILTP
ncbi:retropepsin-like aspartic protease family protein [Polymorphum gilvum]|uniref:Eukaryotic/viral aspartic protease, active site n=1 Tax=Polymorphum gilvum (strain LMG 25793 / CGMCC 1.9160 / SL003B-26A1) TaxID=991905 RepID=F2J600_POLGS|nr:TIGR02281 family clan AA aspartic protease [Polymorphum gilvum]ADZ71254.1 Eukaryotic/viral aspartic protease, active site [Polymorphum gilvum SL003B-26A1]